MDETSPLPPELKRLADELDQLTAIPEARAANRIVDTIDPQLREHYRADDLMLAMAISMRGRTITLARNPRRDEIMAQPDVRTKTELALKIMRLAVDALEEAVEVRQ